MAHGHFVGLFLRGVARQAIARAGTMVGEFGARLERDAWQELTRFLSAPKDAGASAVRNFKALSALGRWFGFEWDEICSGLVGFGGCKIPRTRLAST